MYWNTGRLFRIKTIKYLTKELRGGHLSKVIIDHTLPGVEGNLTGVGGNLGISNGEILFFNANSDFFRFSIIICISLNNVPCRFDAR